MTRKKDRRVSKNADERLIDTPKPRGFVARPCSMCEGIRPSGTSYSRVYSKHGQLRYCKCDFCGNTWSQFFENIATCIAITDTKPLRKPEPAIALGHGIGSKPSSTD